MSLSPYGPLRVPTHCPSSTRMDTVGTMVASRTARGQRPSQRLTNSARPSAHVQRFRPLALLVIVAAAMCCSAGPIVASSRACREVVEAVAEPLAPPNARPAEVGSDAPCESVLAAIEMKADRLVCEPYRHSVAVLSLGRRLFGKRAVSFIDGRDFNGNVHIPFMATGLVPASDLLSLRAVFVSIRGFRHALPEVSVEFTDENEKCDGESWTAFDDGLGKLRRDASTRHS